MRIPRLTLRTQMIANAILVLVLAPILASLIQSIKNSAWDWEFYGPGGVLQRRGRVWGEIGAGREALEHHRPSDAEVRFRSALFDTSLNIGPVPVDVRCSFFRERFDALGGLADALVAQDRFGEAMPLYEEALEALEGGLKVVAPEVNVSNDPQVAELIERQAACRRSLHRGVLDPGAH